MFLRLLWESFARQRRRKLLAAVAILLGTTAVTAMLALALSIGDRIHHELAAYGANIVVYPKAEALSLKVDGVDVRPATGGALLKESDLEKLKGIFWANNITGVSPELDWSGWATADGSRPLAVKVSGMWFDHEFGSLRTGAVKMHPWWKLEGRWPGVQAAGGSVEAVVGQRLASHLLLHVGSLLKLNGQQEFSITGIVTTGDEHDDEMLASLADVQRLSGEADGVSRVEVSARTKPEDAFARQDPDRMTPKQHDIWYCRPYANSIAYQIQEVMTGSKAEQVRRVEQTEGNVLSRISGLMWLVSGAALLAAGFAVSAAMATAVLERRREIGLMRSLGASKVSVAMLFYAESGLLAVLAGTAGYLGGSLLAYWLGGRIFPDATAAPLLNPVLLPVVVALALVVAVAGSTPSIRRALALDPSTVLRVDA